MVNLPGPDDPMRGLDVGQNLLRLCKKAGARSGWVQIGSELIDSNLLFGEEQIEQMTSVVHEMATSYAEVGRQMETIFFGFSRQFLVVVCEGQKRLALLFPGDQKPIHNNIIIEIRGFLRQLPGGGGEEKIVELNPQQTQVVHNFSQVTKSSEPRVHWPTLAPLIKSLLARVVNSGQAQTLIDRTLQERGMPDGPADLSIPDVARQIISQIPHRGKRAAISAELSDLLEERGLI